MLFTWNWVHRSLQRFWNIVRKFCRPVVGPPMNVWTIIAFYPAGNLLFHFRNSWKLCTFPGKLCNWDDQLHSCWGAGLTLADFIIVKISLVILQLYQYLHFWFWSLVACLLCFPQHVEVWQHLVYFTTAVSNMRVWVGHFSRTRPTMTALIDAHSCFQNHHCVSHCRLCVTPYFAIRLAQLLWGAAMSPRCVILFAWPWYTV